MNVFQLFNFEHLEALVHERVGPKEGIHLLSTILKCFEARKHIVPLTKPYLSSVKTQFGLSFCAVVCSALVVDL